MALVGMTVIILLSSSVNYKTVLKYNHFCRALGIWDFCFLFTR